MKPEPCPQPDHLRSFVSCTVNEQLADQILSHIENCPACEETVAELEASSDTVAERIRKSASQPSFAHEPECQRLMQFLIQETTGGRKLGDSVAVPQTLREYRIIRKLGEGGMGTVYLAEHQRLKRQVALKLLPSSRLGNAEAVARFDREMAVLGQLTHPNIVQAFDAGDHEGQHFLAMEYVDGLTLTELVQQQNPLRIADACELIRQAAQGLQYAHENGFVHRDIKPSNLMLAKTGNRSGGATANVKVLDLGLARALQGEGNPADQKTELTTAGQIMGTIDYMAPEQGGDSHQVDIRADICSLGATLYKLLTGESPFAEHAHKPVLQRLMTIAQQEPKPIQATRPEVPEALVQVVQRMMAKQPAARYSTPAEVAEALESFTDGADLPSLLGLLNPKSSEIPRTALPTTQQIPAANRSGGGIGNRSWQIALFWIPAFLLLSAILVITTKNGTVEVTSPDGKLPDDVSVVVSRDGDEVELLQANNEWSAKIVNGEYQVALRSGDDRFEIKDSTLTVSRLGRTRVELVMKRPPVEIPAPVVAKPSVVPLEIKPDSQKPAPVAAMSVESTTPFVLLRGESVVREFKSLAGAIAEMQAAEIIEIRSSARIPVRLTDSPKHAMTIRAGAGFRPWLDFLALPQEGFPHDLTFEGCDLDLRIPVQITSCVAHRTFLGCRLWGYVSNFNGTHLRCSDCVIVNNGEGFKQFESAPSEVTFDNCLLHNLAYLVSYQASGPNIPESTPDCQHQLRMTNCTYYGIDRGSPSLVGVMGQNRVTIEASNNLYHCDSFTGSLIAEKSRSHVTWRGNDNCFSGPWHSELQPDANGVPQSTVAGLGGWRKLWPETELASREVPRLVLEWGRIQQLTGAERLREVRAACESRVATQQMPPLEINWDLIGPGEAYIKALAAEGRPVAPAELRPERFEAGPVTLIRNGVDIAGYATLQQAADVALDQDIIEIRSDDVFGYVTFNGQDRLLTLRAAPGYSPSVNALVVYQESSDRLILEGLSFESNVHWSANYGFPPTQETPMFPGRGVLVRMQNCRFLGPNIQCGGWMNAEEGQIPEIRNCDFDTLALGLKTDRVRISNSVFECLTLGSEFGRSVPPHLEIDTSVFWNPDAHTVGILGGISPLVGLSPMAIESRQCLYVNSRALMQNQDYIQWSGDQNIFQLSGQGPVTNKVRFDEWQAELKSDPNSAELRPFEFDPAQWRILRDKSDKYAPRPDGSDYGANIDHLVEVLTSKPAVNSK